MTVRVQADWNNKLNTPRSDAERLELANYMLLMFRVRHSLVQHNSRLGSATRLLPYHCTKISVCARELR